MRVGLTGASGLLGRALGAALAARGDEVVVLARPGSAPSTNPTLAWDPAHQTISPEDARRLGGLDAVVHLAGAGIGERRWSLARRREIRDSRVHATRFLAELLARGGGRAHLVSASAIGYYGSRGDEPLDETSAPGEGFLADVCVAWEDAARGYGVAGGDVALLRTGIVLDARGGALARQLPLFRLGLGGRLGPGTQWVSPISVRDHVRATLFALDHRLSGALNLVAPTPATNAELTRTLARALARPGVVAVPSFALRLALGRQMADELLLSSQRVVPARLEAEGFTFEHPTLAEGVRAALN